MKCILTITLLLLSLTSRAVQSDVVDEVIVLICDARVLEAFERSGDGKINARQIREETGTMVIDGPERRVKFLDEIVTDWGLIRTAEGMIIGGPQKLMIDPSEPDPQPLTITADLLTVDPYVGAFRFYPEGVGFDETNRVLRVPLGSTFYKGECEKAGDPKF